MLLLIAAILCGTAFRIALSFNDGYVNDLHWFAVWMERVTTGGFAGLYELPFVDYPPLYFLVLRGLGGLLTLVGQDLADEASMYPWLRAPACLADALIAILLFVEGRRLIGPRAGLAAAVLYLFNPVSLYVSGYWGQVDSVHSLFILAALIACNRRRPVPAGVFLALALLQKLQSIAFAPLIIFDLYRSKRWAGMGALGLGFVFAVVVVLLPFQISGTTEQALRRGYARAVGSYPYRSMNAFNLWSVGGYSGAVDNVPPRLLLRAAAEGATRVRDDGAWFLQLTYRRLSMMLFALMTATILSLYARFHRADIRALTAGALGLCFFVCLTEIHERYSFPVIALLPLWAMVTQSRERVYLILSVLILLNLTTSQPVEEIAGEIGLMVTVVLIGFAALLAFGPIAAKLPAAATTETHSLAEDVSPRSRLITTFQILTVVAWIGCLAQSALLVHKGLSAPEPSVTDAQYLSDLEPVVAEQGWGSLGRDSDAGGAPIHVGDYYFLRGLGTHAPGKYVFEIPPGYRLFKATVGIDRSSWGHAQCRVLLDGQIVLTTPELSSETEPFHLSVELRGARHLTLLVDPLGSDSGDHVDWADARLVR